MAPLYGRPESGPDPHDISVTLPGGLMLRLLSRHPLRGDVATRGLIIREFKDGDTKYSVYIGLAKRPIGEEPYLRFLTVVGKSTTGMHPTEGVYIHGDPFSVTSVGNRTADFLLAKISRPETLPVVKNCYKVIAGIYKMMLDLEMFSGERFVPIQRIGKALSLHTAKILLGSFLKDPRNGARNLLQEVIDEIGPQAACSKPSCISFTELSGGLNLIEYDGFTLLGRPKVLVPACYASGVTVGLQQFVPLHVQKDWDRHKSVSTGIEVEPGIALHVVELIKSLPVVGAYKLFAIGKGLGDSLDGPSHEGESIVVFPYGALKKFEGLYLSKMMLKSMVDDYVNDYDPPWEQGGAMLSWKPG